MKEWGMLIRKHTLDENHFGMESGAGFPEEVIIEVRPDRK